jgi:hypothetical protein
MPGLEPVIFSGITVIPLAHDPVILNGISRSHSAGLAGHFERDYAVCWLSGGDSRQAAGARSGAVDAHSARILAHRASRSKPLQVGPDVICNSDWRNLAL